MLKEPKSDYDINSILNNKPKIKLKKLYKKLQTTRAHLIP